MKGSYDIKINTNKIKYKLNINRNITIIKGDSATGKTKLVKILEDSLRYKNIRIASKIPIESIRYYENRDFPYNIENINNRIFVVDEGSILFKEKRFVDIIKNSDNYFVFITRDKLSQLPYSYKEVYEFKYDKDTNTNYMSRIYKNYEDTITLYNDDIILTEDSNSGKDLINNLYDNIVISSNGKSNIINKILNNKVDLIIADGATIGCDLEDILYNIKDIKLLLFESIEYILLKSNLFNNIDNEMINKNINKPQEYIDSKLYFSWEIYFTNLLIGISSKYPGCLYTKKILNKWYINDKNKNKIKNILHSYIKEINSDVLKWE